VTNEEKGSACGGGPFGLGSLFEVAVRWREDHR